MSDQATKALPNLRTLASELAMQDNACTENPMFVVQQRRRFPTDEDNADGIEWRCRDEDWREATPEEAGKLEAAYDIGTIPRGWARFCYIETWEFITACLTRRAAEQYIAENEHNLTAPRVWVAGSYRNHEWQWLRKYLMSDAVPIAEAAAKGETE